MTTAVSVFIVTLNEAEHIAETIDSVSTLDEVLVVDSGSTDSTVEIAEAHGARVIHQDWLGFAAQKAFALTQCRNEWCINLDGDEVMSPQLLTEVQSIIEEDRADLIRLPIEDLFMGAPMHPASRKRAITRAFKRSLVSYPDDRQVHENILSNGRLVTADNRLLHYGYNDLPTYMSKFNQYAALGAADRYRRGRRASLPKLLVVFPLTFFKVYLLRKLFLSGRRGFIQATVEAMYAFLKEANLLQLERSPKRVDESV